MTQRGAGQPSRAKQADVEQELIGLLTAGEMEEPDKAEQTKANLPPKYEVRVQSAYEPVAEETRLYRSMAQELDDRYDKYVKQDADPPSAQQPPKPE